MPIGENLKKVAVVGIGASLYPTVKSWVDRMVPGVGLPLAGVSTGALVTAVISAWAMDKTSGLTRDLVAGIGVGALAELFGTLFRPGSILASPAPAPAPVVSSPEAEALAYAQGV